MNINYICGCVRQNAGKRGQRWLHCARHDNQIQVFMECYEDEIKNGVKRP
jgi:hypothetical protein